MERNEYPWLHRAADRASSEAQEKHFRALRCQLTVFFSVALFGAIPTWIALTERGVKEFAVASACFLILGIVTLSVIRERRFDKQWFDARAVAESAKTLAWRYMMRIAPFHFENPKADQDLIDELHALSSSRPTVLQDMSGTENDTTQITSSMRQVRLSSFEERRAYYLASRVAEERDWYGGRAALNRTLSNRWYWAVLSTQVAALVLSVLRAAEFIQLSLAGPLMTLAASFSAWTQARRHDELRTSYSVAADELNNLEAKIELCTTDTELLALVEDVEEAISREHTMWRARRNVAP